MKRLSKIAKATLFVISIGVLFEGYRGEHLMVIEFLLIAILVVLLERFE